MAVGKSYPTLKHVRCAAVHWHSGHLPNRPPWHNTTPGFRCSRKGWMCFFFLRGSYLYWSGQIIVCHPPRFPSNKGISRFPSAILWWAFLVVFLVGLQFDQISSVYRWCLNSDLTILQTGSSYLGVDPRSKDSSGKDPRESRFFVFLQETAKLDEHLLMTSSCAPLRPP